jgi:hypothetical protein
MPCPQGFDRQAMGSLPPPSIRASVGVGSLVDEQFYHIHVPPPCCLVQGLPVVNVPHKVVLPLGALPL